MDLEPILIANNSQRSRSDLRLAPFGATHIYGQDVAARTRCRLLPFFSVAQCTKLFQVQVFESPLWYCGTPLSVLPCQTTGRVASRRRSNIDDLIPVPALPEYKTLMHNFLPRSWAQKGLGGQGAGLTWDRLAVYSAGNMGVAASSVHERLPWREMLW